MPGVLLRAMSRDLFESNLPLIERLLRSVCRRNAFPPDESEEFASWAKLRLIDDDYAVFRKFEGRASLPTYLTTVIVNLFRDYRIHRWGKWRPSAEAKRLGTLAIQLETLVARDGRTLAEAIAVLRTSFGVTRPAAELEQLAARLPERIRRRQEGDEALAVVAAADATAERLVDGERRATAARAEATVTRALAELDADERLVLKLRFADGLAIVDIARLLGVPAKPLYGRIERTLAAVRRTLEGDGLEASSVLGLLGWSGLDLTIDFGADSRDAGARPSPGKEMSV
jgi:RNA polymerase sigma factor for flagellar operon FliA